MKRTSSQVVLLSALLFGSFWNQNSSLAQPNDSFDVSIQVDAAKSTGELRPIWRFFGGDEPNYVYMKDGEKLLNNLGSLRRDDVYFRGHNLLTSGDGTPALKWGSSNAYTLDEQGNPVYDWTIVDYMFDTMVKHGVKPYVEIGFMPKALSTKPEPYRHEWRPGLPYDRIMTGWRYPPKDYNEWEELVYQLAKHCADRHGEEEVLRWYWQTWNEANANPHGYWGGSTEEFYKLNDYTIRGVRRAIPNARVGGPHSAGSGGDFTRGFLKHCLRGKNYATGETGTPLDFISFHAKGAPKYVDGHVRMGIANQMATLDRGFRIVAEFPELKDTPIVIGESDPEGCAACQGPMFSYRNGTVYSSYTAASFARKQLLAERRGVHLEGALTWAFEFEDQPYFAGFRQLATNGIPMPVLNVFRMFSRMSGDRLQSESSSQVSLDDIIAHGVRKDPDVGVLASRDGDRLCVFVWHYHDDDIAGPTAKVDLRLAGLDQSWANAKLQHFRIDEFQSNSYDTWRRMGSPNAPNAKQYDELLKSSDLATIDQAAATWTDGQMTLNFELPRQGVSLIELVKE